MIASVFECVYVFKCVFVSLHREGTVAFCDMLDPFLLNSIYVCIVQTVHVHCLMVPDIAL